MNQFFWADTPKKTAFPIAGPGYPYIYASVFVTVIFALIGIAWLAVLGIITTFFICYFFRDPDRITPAVEGAIISPADGRVVYTGVVNSNPFIPGSCLKIGIFMSIFNVHVNRIPQSGVVRKILYYPGKFYSADKDIASLQNEYNAVILETEKNQSICCVQIAGLIARRIICSILEGDTVVRGQRFGLICFGSRVDVYLPLNTEIQVSMGDRVAAGTSILGTIH
jgi:phosphatidylserine decarboxylase